MIKRQTKQPNLAMADAMVDALKLADEKAAEKAAILQAEDYWAKGVDRLERLLEKGNVVMVDNITFFHHLKGGVSEEELKSLEVERFHAGGYAYLTEDDANEIIRYKLEYLDTVTQLIFMKIAPIRNLTIRKYLEPYNV